MRFTVFDKLQLKLGIPEVNYDSRRDPHHNREVHGVFAPNIRSAYNNIRATTTLNKGKLGCMFIDLLIFKHGRRPA